MRASREEEDKVGGTFWGHSEEKEKEADGYTYLLSISVCWWEEILSLNTLRRKSLAEELFILNRLYL